MFKIVPYTKTHCGNTITENNIEKIIMLQMLHSYWLGPNPGNFMEHERIEY